MKLGCLTALQTLCRISVSLLDQYIPQSPACCLSPVNYLTNDHKCLHHITNFPVQMSLVEFVWHHIFDNNTSFFSCLLFYVLAETFHQKLHKALLLCYITMTMVYVHIYYWGALVSPVRSDSESSLICRRLWGFCVSYVSVLIASLSAEVKMFIGYCVF